MERDGVNVYDSAICIEWLEAQYPQPPLFPTDINGRVRQKMIVERFQSVSFG